MFLHLMEIVSYCVIVFCTKKVKKCRVFFNQRALKPEGLYIFRREKELRKKMLKLHFVYF